jgi:hypothetical protein
VKTRTNRNDDVFIVDGEVTVVGDVVKKIASIDRAT